MPRRHGSVQSRLQAFLSRGNGIHIPRAYKDATHDKCFRIQCGDPNELGHDEVCGGRNRWTVKRHDAVKRALGGALASVDSTEVTMEPGTEEGRRRNDLQVRGRAMCRPVDYDIKIYSLLDRDAHKTTTSTKGNSIGDHITSQALRWLETIEKRTLARAPASLAILRPLVFSPGGLVAKLSWEELGKWKEGLGTLRWRRLPSQISLELLRACLRCREPGDNSEGGQTCEEASGSAESSLRAKEIIQIP